jgi:hypothetical protein
VADDLPKATNGHVTSGSGGDPENPDDLEKEERRRAAQKVFGKQGYFQLSVLQTYKKHIRC